MSDDYSTETFYQAVCTASDCHHTEGEYWAGMARGFRSSAERDAEIHSCAAVEVVSYESETRGHVPLDAPDNLLDLVGGDDE